MPKRPGPPPLPAEVIDLHGNRGNRSRAEIEERRDATVLARPIAPSPPADLSPDERECWDMHAAALVQLGLLTELDGGAFRLCCEAYGLARAARRAMLPTRKDGSPDRRSKTPAVLVVDRDGMPRRAPAFIVWKQASEEYRRWTVEFGLTPSARIGLRPAAAGPVGTVPDDGDDDQAFFGT